MGRNKKNATLGAVLEKKGIPRSTYSSRIKRGWTKDRALNEPINQNVGRPRAKDREEPISVASELKKIYPTVVKALEMSDLERRALTKIGELVLENAALKAKLNI